jgi:membrane protein
MGKISEMLPESLGRGVERLDDYVQGRFNWLALVWQGFLRDNCLLQASALAFTTVLSLVPLLAVAFTISKGFGIQNTQFIRQFLGHVTTGREEVVQAIIEYINRTDVSTLGTVGIFFLLFVAVSLISNIERSMNTIWGVKRGRTIWRKVTDYLFLILIVPLLFIIALSATASVQNMAMVKWLTSVSVFSEAYLLLLKLLPFAASWIGLFILYLYIPNTKVHLSAALLGAIIAGTLWQLSQMVYIWYQTTIAPYNAIYGSFSQVPIFLIWMFITWIIILLGAEIGFAFQYRNTYARERSASGYSFDDRQKLAVMALGLLTSCFENDKFPPGNQKIAAQLKAPVKLVNEVMNILSESGFVTKRDTEDPSYTLARSPGKVKVMDVFVALTDYREVDEGPALDERFEFMEELFNELVSEAYGSDKNMTLDEFAEKWSDVLAGKGDGMCVTPPKAVTTPGAKDAGGRTAKENLEPEAQS